MSIANNAIIHSSVDLGDHVTVGPFSILGPGVSIGEGTEIGPHVVIESGAAIGKNCRLFQGAFIGGEPQIVDFKDVPSTVRIGDHTTIREYVTVHRSAEENGATVVGRHCLLMAYSHVAHDCEVGDHVVIVNYTGLSGHIVVEDHAFISGMVGLHQHVRIGSHSMVGGMSGVSQDVLPYATVSGYPARLVGINAVGLRRRDFKPKVRSAIKQVFKWIQNPELNTSQAIKKIESEIEMCDEIRYLVNFMKNSKRGFVD